MGVIEFGEQQGFAFKAPAIVLFKQLSAQAFDRYLAI
jgi:hypothetical protein